MVTILPPYRRPRERLQQYGAAAMSLTELLCILLGSGSAQHPVDTLSDAIERLFLSSRVSIENLQQIPGIGQAKAAIICAALEIGKRGQSLIQKTIFATPADIYNACRDLCSLPQENLVVFYLNVRNQSVERELITIGTASASLIHPREIFRPAILHNASSVILAHNHPSGCPTPSEADCLVTQRLALAGEQLGITVLDHVICAEQGFTSLREQQPALFFLADQKAFC